VTRTSGKREAITYKGRTLGILIVTGAQLLIGVIHFVIGLMLLAAETSINQATSAYAVYTALFGALVLVFAVFIWQGKKAGWIGTCAISIFVILADTLTVLNLPSVPAIPKFAAPTEIGYSILLIIYLSLPHVRRKFKV